MTPPILKRYTSLPVLLDLLKRKRLVLLDPASWEDKNDSAILLEYKKRRKIPKLCALCFSQGDETIHHWNTYASGISGCCIEFSGRRLEESFKRYPSLRYGPVTYRKIGYLANHSIPVDKIPFTKRWPYRCEEEYRVIWEGESGSGVFEVDIDLRAIARITLSQKMPAQVYDTIREYLREAFRDPDKRISRSTLYENRVWIDKFKYAGGKIVRLPRVQMAKPAARAFSAAASIIRKKAWASAEIPGR
jgi:hypothetical protein